MNKALLVSRNELKKYKKIIRKIISIQMFLMFLYLIMKNWTTIGNPKIKIRKNLFKLINNSYSKVKIIKAIHILII